MITLGALKCKLANILSEPEPSFTGYSLSFPLEGSALQAPILLFLVVGARG